MARESVGLYRRLARADAAYRPQLGSALSLLGVALSRLGLHAEARKATKESVALYRRLTSADPAAHAVGLAQEAVDLYRQLARAEPAVHRRDVAMALGNSPGPTSAGRRRRPPRRSRSPSCPTWARAIPASTAPSSQTRSPCSRRHRPASDGSRRRPAAGTDRAARSRIAGPPPGRAAG
ncbi:hypothetical protein ACFY04_32650 [Streptomyces sp. NPDC001549]|uniref:hypothetical protein n=1 Tax=Streptomyces sp. NPDC001549 TaxID=3364586 RepID=UPI0036AB23EA